MSNEDTATEVEVTRISNILNSIGKTLKAFTTYPPNNPIYKRFSTDLFQKFNLYFSKNDNMLLKVEQFSLYYKNVEVYYNQERSENIAFLLFADGIKEICFFKGITDEEILALLDILRLVIKKSDTIYDNIVTLLWERDLPHITFFAPEIENISGDFQINFDSSQTTLLSIPPYTPPTEEEVKNLRLKTESIDGNKLLFSGNILFFELIESEKDDLVLFKEISRNIDIILQLFLERGAMDEAISLMQKLGKVLEVDLNPERRNIIIEIISKAGDYSVIKDLVENISDLEKIKQFLLSLNKSTIPHLIKLFEEKLENKEIEGVISDVLAIKCKEDLEIIVKLFKANNLQIQIGAIEILGKIKDPRVVGYLERCLRQSEVTVRREAIKNLLSLDLPEIKKPLVTALKDEEPSHRIAALRGLKKIGGNDLVEILKGIISGKDFIERDFMEKKEFMEIFGEIGKDFSFSILAEFFGKKGLFLSGKIKDLRICAAYGLGKIGSAEALKLLEKEKDSKDNMFQEACRKSIYLAKKK